ncbi:1946_t:CDS:2, partial [Racocetra fulgida]
PNIKSNLFDGTTLCSKILFNFHVKASIGQKCINLASRNLITQEPVTATLFDIEKCTTLSLRNAIHCLGDVEILFPIIMKFDNLDSVSLQAPFGSQDDFFASEGPCKAFFALLSSLLQNNSKSQNHIVKSRDLAQEVYSNLVFEFRLWMYATIDIQKYCIDFLKTFIDARKLIDDSETPPLVLPPIKNFKIIVAILALLDSEATKKTVQCRILEDLVLMFKQNITFCTELHKIWLWQKYLIRLVPIYSRRDDIISGKGDKDITDWALEFIAIVIWNLFDVDKDAYRI